MPPDQELALLEQIMDELLLGIQEALQSGERLSDELQNMLAEEIEITVSRIDQLRAEIQQGQTGQVQRPVVPQGMPSSNVKGMNYDKKNGNLLVQFLGKHPNQNGPVYQYPNVPPVIAELLQSGAIPARTDGQNKWGKWWKGKVPSAGASVFTLLKNKNAPFQRLS